MADRGSLAINWCFTLNNYTEEEYEQLVNYNGYNYLVIGREIGKEGTPHLQGYIQLKKKMRLTGVKKINNRAHWEISKGTPEENKKYCSKDGNFIEMGTMQKQGKKKCDLVKAVHDILDKKTTEEMLEEHGSGKYILCKHNIISLIALWTRKR